jgi:ATP-binding cassette, subfamily B, bacterial
MANKSKIHILIRVYGYSRKFIPHMFGILFLTLLSTPLVLLNPVPLTIVIDSVFGDKPLPPILTQLFPTSLEYNFETMLFIAVSLLIAIAFVKSIQGLLLWLLHSYAGEKLVLSFRNILFGHIQRMSLTYHDQVGISDSIYRIQYDAASIKDLVLNALSPLLTALFTVFGMLYIMVALQWQLAVIAIAVIPFLYFFTNYSSNKLKENWLNVKESESAAMSVIHETLSSLRVVKAFVRESHHQKHFLKKSEKAITGHLRLAFIGGGYDLSVGLLIAVGTAVFLYQGATFVRAGELSVGELVLLMSYLGQLFGPMSSISKQINFLQSSFASLERVVALLDENEDVKEDSNPTRIERCNGAVEFKQVEFYYKDNQPVLNNISFKVNPGQKVGIVGTTGSGKSTILSLLTRFYEPTSGEILVDNININKYKLTDYRNQFGIVLQEPVLFSTTIAENIAYGKPNADMDEIVEAAKVANAHDFISAFPNGYNTQVGERGFQMSGGERQRISIARAFLKNAPILILDEPTSSVDSNTEGKIMEAMDRLMEGRTNFLVTHRLNTLNKCDILIHLEMGKIVDIVSNHNEDEMKLKIKSLRMAKQDG